jgi:glycosyltransferase involved in cell wall biosynthesis
MLPPSVFAIVANGFAEGPAQALRDYLVGREARVMTIFHPLTPEQGTRHVITTYANGRRVRERTIHLPLRPPLSFLLDPLIPLLPPRVDAWFGFNPLACARGLVARSHSRADFVVVWSVDFVPDRFGIGTLPTRVYDRLDKLCCMRADGRVELSETARDARNRRHDLPSNAPQAQIVPMGAWIDRMATTPTDGFRRRRVVFLGHLVLRQGVEKLLEALAVLVDRGEEVAADIVGTGPLEARLRQRANSLGLERLVRFRGFVADHRDVERLLAGSSIAVAPYRPSEDTFTRFADPGKLKVYLAAGLPIVLTGVPPNARELAQAAGAEVVDYDAAAIADAISMLLANPEAWRARRRAALTYARRFDWAVLLPDVLVKLGLDPGSA